MSAAYSTAAHRGHRRWSRVSFLVAAAGALLLLAQVGAVVYADQPQPQPKPEAPQPLTPDQQRVENVIAAAKQYLGVPYRVGSEGPALFDCSGLVFRSFSDTGLLDRIGGARLRAAGYMRYFAGKGLMTADESQAQRGDLVIYNNGAHIGIYLGDGRVISALLSGVTVHSLSGISLPVTGFLRPDWSGNGKVAPFVPITNLPDVAEVPATLVPAADWMPTLDPALSAPVAREGTERVDLRTPTSRTFANPDGTFTTEFHAQPIFYQPAGTTDPADLEPINLGFSADAQTGYATVGKSPVAVTARAADDDAGFVSASAGDRSVSLSLATAASMAASNAQPQIVDAGRVVDYFDFQPQSVGLRVLAQTDGFKAFLVLTKVPQHNKFSFVINAPGLTPVLAADGSVLLTDEDGNAAARIPRPLLLDSSDVDGSGGGVVTKGTSLSLDTSGPLPVLSVSVRRSVLEEAVMPAYLDLSLTEFGQTAAGADVAFASSAYPNASLHGMQRPESAGYDDLWLGREPGTRSNNEVYVRFDGLKDLLGTVDVASASLELLPYLQGGAGEPSVRRVTQDWNADYLTWNARPLVDLEDSVGMPTRAGAWSSLDVSSYVTDVLSRGQPDYGLMLAGDQASKSWDRLAASDAGAAVQFGPRLVVTWSGLRPTATSLMAASDASATTLSWTNPLLAATQTRYEVQVSHDGFATLDADSGAVKGKAGKLLQWTLPPSAVTTTGTYQWRVRARYGPDKAWSSWSAAQTVRLVVSPFYMHSPFYVHSPL